MIFCMCNKAASVFALFLFVVQTASADTLILKSGESKKGKVLGESKGQVLFERAEDRMVIELPKSSISIVGRDEDNGSTTKKRYVNFFSEPSKDKKRQRTDAADDRASVQAELFTKFENFIMRWIEEHPGVGQKIQEALAKSKSKSDQLDELVKAAKQG